LHSTTSSYPSLFIFIFAVVDLSYQDDRASFSGSLVHLAEDVLEGEAQGAHDNATPVCKGKWKMNENDANGKPGEEA
jgi:hypothetical protein